MQTTTDLDTDLVERAYARWAPVYDALCGPIFESGRRAAAQAARAVGGRILEVGVGTGLSFDDYDATTEIVGIDLSAPMVAKARERMAIAQQVGCRSAGFQPAWRNFRMQAGCLRYPRRTGAASRLTSAPASLTGPTAIVAAVASLNFGCRRRIPAHRCAARAKGRALRALPVSGRRDGAVQAAT
jgi:SAM-dependent methyltransferase